jgi:acetamidase/formamidase
VAKEHHFDPAVFHHDWDPTLAPALVVQPGDVVHFELKMAGDGQVEETSTIDRVAWDWSTLYNLGGPLFVEGAEPGDTLEIEILSFKVGVWGWTVVLPELGLLADDYPDPFLKITDLRGAEKAIIADGVAVPIQPFLGTMGVMTDRPQALPPFPPTTVAATSTVDT